MTKKMTGFILAFAAAAFIVFSSFPTAFGYCGTGSSSDLVLKVCAEDEEVSEQPTEESDESGAEKQMKLFPARCLMKQ